MNNKTDISVIIQSSISIHFVSLWTLHNLLRGHRCIIYLRGPPDEIKSSEFCNQEELSRQTIEWNKELQDIPTTERPSQLPLNVGIQQRLSERIEREDNSESLQDTRPQVGAFFFFLPISFFLFLSQSAPAFLFTTIRYTFKALFCLSRKGENCSADLFSFVSPFSEANRSLIVKFRLGPVHHFLIKRVKPPPRKNIVPFLYGCKTIKVAASLLQ